MLSSADYPAVIEHKYQIGIHDGAYALRDNDGGGIRKARMQRFSEVCIRLIVERARAVIQNKYFRVRGNGSCDEHTLLLTSADIGTPCGELIIELFGKLIEHALRLSKDDSAVDLLNAQITAEADILVNAVRHDKVILECHAEFTAEFLPRYASNVPAVNEHLTFIGVIEADEHIDYGGFAAAGRADYAEGLTPFQSKVYILKVVFKVILRSLCPVLLFLPIISKCNMPELDMGRVVPQLLLRLNKGHIVL